jgi:hypothetical protein
LLLTACAAAGRADIGLLAVAAWTLASLVFHIVRVVQAFVLRMSGTAPASWLESGEPVSGIARWAA